MRLQIMLVIILLLVGCSNAAGKNEKWATQKGKGELTPMKTYHIGRFVIDVPGDFRLAVQSHEFRLVEIEELPDVVDPLRKWKEHIAAVEKNESREESTKL